MERTIAKELAYCTLKRSLCEEDPTLSEYERRLRREVGHILIVLAWERAAELKLDIVRISNMLNRYLLKYDTTQDPHQQQVLLAHYAQGFTS